MHSLLLLLHYRLLHYRLLQTNQEQSIAYV